MIMELTKFLTIMILLFITLALASIDSNLKILFLMLAVIMLSVYIYNIQSYEEFTQTTGAILNKLTTFYNNNNNHVFTINNLNVSGLLTTGENAGHSDITILNNLDVTDTINANIVFVENTATLNNVNGNIGSI
jgi:uncharacterized repeat protein (TIGR01451 family)